MYLSVTSTDPYRYPRLLAHATARAGVQLLREKRSVCTCIDFFDAAAGDVLGAEAFF